MATDDDRRRTAGERRERIIATLSRELDPKNPASAASRLDGLIRGAARPMVVSGDIDGLVSAAMLRRAAPEWDAVALIVKSGKIYLHPDVVAGLSLADSFGVDVFSTYMPNVSNHVALWGSKAPGSSPVAARAAAAYDATVRLRGEKTLLGTPSLWAGIEGGYGSADRGTSAMYRYPLGTAQVLLALLEVVDRSPKLFDREYLPWLVANCDGGLKTIRDYPANVPMWWGALAAAVGPASVSEQVYQTAANQRPTEFVDIVNRLRAEGHEVVGAPAEHLDEKWNLLKKNPLDNIAPVTRWISSLSGWPDPFRGGVQHLHEWKEVPLDRHGKLPTAGLPKGRNEAERVEVFKAHLRASLGAAHTNYAHFDGALKLNWVAPWDGATVPDLPELPAALQPDLSLFADETRVAEPAVAPIAI